MSSGLDKLCNKAQSSIVCAGNSLKTYYNKNNQDDSFNKISKGYRINGICFKAHGKNYCLNNYTLGILIAFTISFFMIYFFLKIKSNFIKKKKIEIDYINEVEAQSLKLEIA